MPKVDQVFGLLGLSVAVRAFPVSGAYSPCMQGMHCMPSHLAKKENNNFKLVLVKI